ncbi:MAG: glycosyltransferase family 4 protein [Gammaproteobacteria bacterium]
MLGASRAQADTLPSVCLVGLMNLPVLAREYAQHGIGGMQVQQTLLARQLVKHGADVSMVVADLGQPDGASWDGITTWRAFRPTAGIPVFRYIHPRWTGIWSALKRADADIYYVSGAGMLLGLVAMFARRYGRKVVYRLASTSDCHPDTICVKYWRDRQLYGYGLRSADLVLSQTAEQQRLMLKNYQRKSLVVPSLIDPAGRCRSFSERSTDVLWVGALRPLKRPKLLLDLARRLPHLTFEIAGGPSPDAPSLFNEVKREAQALPNVRFLGQVPYHDVGSLFERARLLVGTSEIEGVPNTYLQAWGHGTPVVAYIDPEHLIAENGLGRAVHSADEMAEAVSQLLGEPDSWAGASTRCREFAATRADENTRVQLYVDALRRLQIGSGSSLGHPEEAVERS